MKAGDSVRYIGNLWDHLRGILLVIEEVSDTHLRFMFNRCWYLKENFIIEHKARKTMLPFKSGDLIYIGDPRFTKQRYRLFEIREADTYGNVFIQLYGSKNEYKVSMRNIWDARYGSPHVKNKP